MTNVKVLWAIIGLLLVAVSGMAFMFIQGDTVETDDGRTAVLLNKDERNVVLGEMRAFIVSVQAISRAISANNMEEVVSLSTAAGMAAEKDTPGALLRKIPLSMKTLGLGIREKFDILAATTKEKQDPKIARKQLEDLMSNCIACHATFRIPEARN